ncbi:unnamed protein product, partial [Porites evermanni]
MPEDGGICFCRAQPDKNIITCSNSECPYKDSHISCLGLESVTLPKTWYCPHCSRLPQFKRKKGKSHAQHKNQQNAKTIGSIDKTSVLANLTSSDFDIINDPNGWLDCSIIQQAQVLLQQHNPLIDGLQQPTLGQVRNFDIASGEFIQILHTGTDHW